MTDPSFNLLQLDSRPNWYDHLDSVEAAMADERRTSATRRAAGWEADEGGWYAPDGTHESDWELEGYPFPEDPGYAAWAQLMPIQRRREGIRGKQLTAARL